jgi:hypothetical protein
MCDVYYTLSDHWQNIKNLPITFGVKMYVHAKNKKRDRDIWDMWLVQFANMSKDNYKSFEEYKKSILVDKTQYTQEKTNEEICEEFDSIVAAYKRQVM